MDKTRFKDEKGRFIVQGLFLEDRYNTDLAVYTYADEDKTYKGKVYPSLKKLYIEHSDPIEYDFATTHLASWGHWQRLDNNKTVSLAIEEWRNELKLKLMSEGVNMLIHIATEKDSYQAAKWLADRGWDTRERGRPSKDEIEGEIKKAAEAQSEWDEDVILLKAHKGK
jgi:hypothetical protein